MNCKSSVLSATFVVLVGGRVALGDVIRVPEDQPTIQAGIDAAVNGDEVVIGDGIWTGPDNTNLDFDGKVITVRSANGPGACTIDGENVVGTRAFIFQNEEPPEARVEGLTIRRCVVSNSDGGAIHCGIDCEPTIEGCVFARNRANEGYGGALSVNSSSIIGCSFLGNLAGSGGAVFGLRFVIRDCSFVQNIANSGGAIFTVCGSVIEDSSFEGNLAAHHNFAEGGAITVSGCVDIARCTFEDNHARAVPADARAGGGAIFSIDGGHNHVRDSVFQRNRAIVDGAGPEAAAAGGAIYGYLNGNLDLFGCLFDENTATALGSARGGAVYHAEGTGFRAVNCTFSNNSVQGDDESGRAIWLSVFDDIDPSILNSIVWQSGSGSGLLTVGRFSPDPTVEYCDIKGGWPGTRNINADPLFVDAIGGNLRLAAGSPCIDAASNDAVPPERTEDLDGTPRFADDPETPDTGQGDPPVVDMGAYEFQPADCPADLDGSGDVGFDDLLLLVNAWGPCDDCPEDLDDSGDVGFDDLLMLLAGWGPC